MGAPTHLSGLDLRVEATLALAVVALGLPVLLARPDAFDLWLLTVTCLTAAWLMVRILVGTERLVFLGGVGASVAWALTG